MANTNIPVSVISISTERKPIVFTPTSTLCTFGSKCNKKECKFVLSGTNDKLHST